MPPDTFYAHSLPGKPTDQWEPLADYLRNVARLARDFAVPFGAGAWAEFLGLWHDLGKYSTEFQNYIAGASGAEADLEENNVRVDHSSAGAQLPQSLRPSLRSR